MYKDPFILILTYCHYLIS